VTWDILTGDVREMLPTLAPKSVQCVVTSPPYYGLRDYGIAGQIGMERTLPEYLAAMVDVFRLVRDVLADDGTVWLNIGDSFASSGGIHTTGSYDGAVGRAMNGVPARLAIALQDDGWYLRSDIIWHKPNPMPESVTDRPTSAHEHIFLLTKSPRYYYDAAAIAEPVAMTSVARLSQPSLAGQVGSDRANGGAKTNGTMKAVRGNHKGSTFHTGKTADHQLGRASSADRIETDRRNARNVWSIATVGFPGAHFAVYPPEIPRRCILAGSREGDTILDPFAGAGTTLLVADRLNRNAIGIELNPTYADMARKRIYNDAPLFQEQPA
jgi:DNA modification methylase